MKNKDENVINDFGEEWKTYNQKNLSGVEQKTLFENYFNIFPFKKINKTSVGFDMGCGSGRWAKLIAPKVKTLFCVDPSIEALDTAKKNLLNYKNCKFENSDVMTFTIKNSSQDFGYSLGVLHHIPNTFLGIKNCVKKLKKGAPFLIYLYYRFDNKPLWYRYLWKLTDHLRKIISKMPFKIKLLITYCIALTIYFPLARISFLMEKNGINVQNFPLSSYRYTSFYTMKTDALDRFGTKLETRFTKKEITIMMKDAGLTNIEFSKSSPFWVAVGEKK